MNEDIMNNKTKNIMSISIFVAFISTIFFLSNRSEKNAFNKSFYGIVEEVYICSKSFLCVKFKDNNAEHYLGHYACREGASINVGDSLSKSKNDYNLYLFKKNKKGTYIQYNSFSKYE